MRFGSVLILNRGRLGKLGSGHKADEVFVRISDESVKYAANHQWCPSGSTAPYSRNPYGWSCGSDVVRAPAAFARAKCASMSGTLTPSPEGPWGEPFGARLAAAAVRRC